MSEFAENLFNKTGRVMISQNVTPASGSGCAGPWIIDLTDKYENESQPDLDLPSNGYLKI